MYLIFAKLPLINHYTKKTRLKLEMVNDYTEYEIRRKTGSLVLTYSSTIATNTNRCLSLNIKYLLLALFYIIC